MTNEEFIESIKLDNEEWRDVVGYEGYYMVSSYGRVLSMGVYVKSKNGSYRYRNPKLKKIGKLNTGYAEVRISKNGNNRTFAVHRLVAKAFIPNPTNEKTIDHIDRNRMNNNVNNLRWCSLSENMKNPLTIEHIRKIKSNIKIPRLYKKVVRIDTSNSVKTYESMTSTTEDGYNPRTVYMACSGRMKTYKGYKWMYLSDYENLVNMSKNS